MTKEVGRFLTTSERYYESERTRMSCRYPPVRPINTTRQLRCVVMAATDQQPAGPEKVHYNTFSIIIPTYKRPTQLATCLEAVNGLDYPKDSFEVLVVDDGSQDPPQELVQRFAHRIQIQLIKKSHAGPAAGRNTGAQHARGELLAFT